MTLEDELTVALKGTYYAARERGYIATYFLQMLEEFGGVETAKRLLGKKEPQQGLYKLWELDMLSCTLEAVVLQERFRGLFSQEELAESEHRLAELGYFKH